MQGRKGKWLWLSWQSGRFQYQRSAVRLQSLEKFILNICLFIISCIEKTKINKKRPGMAHFLKNMQGQSLNIVKFSSGGILAISIGCTQSHYHNTQINNIRPKYIESNCSDRCQVEYINGFRIIKGLKHYVKDKKIKRLKRQWKILISQPTPTGQIICSYQTG